MKNNIILRDMLQEEADSLYREAKRNFSLVEALGASKPKNALVAEADGEIAGALFLKTYRIRGNRKLGYLDLAYVKKKHRGKGIGNMLYPAAVDKLKKEGCETVCAMVKDENVASWKLLVKQYFTKPDYIAFFREFGLFYGLLVWLRTLYCIACGMNFWISKPCKERKTVHELAAFFGINLLIFSFRGIYVVVHSSGGSVWQESLVFVLVLAVSVLGGFVGTLFSKERWHFQLTRGGLLLSIVLLFLGTCFPLVGRWYPAKYIKNHEQRRSLGITSVCEWAGMGALCLIAFFLFPAGTFQRYTVQASATLLLYHIVAIYPFEHFGGSRVYHWNKAVFLILSLATVLLVFLV